MTTAVHAETKPAVEKQLKVRVLRGDDEIVAVTALAEEKHEGYAEFRDAAHLAAARSGERKWAVMAYCAPWYSTRRRSMVSWPFSRCRMRIGVGTPLATQNTVSVSPPLLRDTRMAS